MGSKLYVGGLPYSATESQLTTLFAEHGTVESARVIADKFTGQSRGFGFVEMSTAEEAQAAITALNGSQLGWRPLTVNEARPWNPVPVRVGRVVVDDLAVDPLAGAIKNLAGFSKRGGSHRSPPVGFLGSQSVLR